MSPKGLLQSLYDKNLLVEWFFTQRIVLGMSYWIAIINQHMYISIYCIPFMKDLKKTDDILLVVSQPKDINSSWMIHFSYLTLKSVGTDTLQFLFLIIICFVSDDILFSINLGFGQAHYIKNTHMYHVLYILQCKYDNAMCMFIRNNCQIL